ncbi:uncharacterized protein DUF2490 [Nonlabens dokdonensis]|jgi:hypothetical protein|uniref:DUF2490 domain containing protein n=2 Tax=Nonlabens dokdonensis TaxID=328515 RepID=L7W843_NONDD|nr:DUF2490 domain-containing protein [Nonlabens dokdonensis]AGC76377.1 DUF2490 domain containing protein [Nonlabens dokdonensis DSW-6]PZX44035.1 uncharacterized protein DUF2490 [Nonlabens dokdonensis]
MISFYSRVFLFLLVPLLSFSQIVEDVIVQPSLNISWQTGNRWSFNSVMEQRNITDDGFGALHIQAAQFVGYEVGFYSQIGFVVMYRELFDDSRPEEVRFTEQYVYKRKYNALKVAHRVRWDQRLRGDRTTHRWRYRLSSSLPLNGFATDVSEYYLTASLETVFIAEKAERPGYDQRFSLGLGRQLSKNLKLQLVTEYRFEDFTANTERLLFLNLGMYYSI